MKMNFEPEVQTSSDNFNLSANKTDKDCSLPQSLWGEMGDDERAYLGKKGLKTPADLLKSYRELEKAYSAKISLPKDGDDEALHKLYSRLGMPENAQTFEIKLNDEDVPFGDDFKQVCFQNNILPKSAQALYNWFVKHRAEQVEKSVDERVSQSFAEMDEQKASWGAKCERNMALMKRGIAIFSNGDEALVDAMEQALGTRKMMQVFCRLGEAVAEDNPVCFGNGTKEAKKFDMLEYFRDMFHDY